MWNIEPNDVIDLSFNSMEPHEVLYEFDSSAIFTFYLAKKLFFAYVSDEDCVLQSTRYLVVATDENEIKSLKLGVVTINKVLTKSLVWAVDRDFDGNLISVNCLAGGMESVPNSHKPRPNTLLYAHLKHNASSVKQDKLQRSISNIGLLTSYQADLLRYDLESSVNKADMLGLVNVDDVGPRMMEISQRHMAMAALGAGFSSVKSVEDKKPTLIGAMAVGKFEQSLNDIRANPASREVLEIYNSSRPLESHARG